MPSVAKRKRAEELKLVSPARCLRHRADIARDDLYRVPFPHHEEQEPQLGGMPALADIVPQKTIRET